MPVDKDLLKQLIREYAPQLHVQDTDIDPERCLAALLSNESNFGKNTKPRVEKVYLPGGKYSKTALVKKAYKEYGESAASSLGPWQIMYVTALELGFKGSPDELAEPENNLEMVIKYLNKRALDKGVMTMSQVADCFNSGNAFDSVKPTGYIRKAIMAYNGLAKDFMADDQT
jgi:hypothetical protein